VTAAMSADAALRLADFGRLARLHRESLPDSPLGRLGLPTLERYYRWAAASPDERLFVMRDAGEIQAAAVVSLAPQTVLRRFVRYAPGTFFAASFGRFVGDGTFRREAVAYARETAGVNEAAELAPELMQIFVSGDRRGRSLGRALLRDVEASLRDRGISAYYTRTLLDDNEPTRRFYQQAGFEHVRRITFFGRPYVLLRRAVPAAAS